MTNPFHFASKYADKENVYNISPEIVALAVFIFVYILLRLIEVYIIPNIPSFFKTEISSILRIGPILIPILYGLTKYKNKDI